MIAYTIHTDVAPRYRRWAQPAMLAAAARAALRHQSAATPAGLTIRVTGDAELRRLNRQFLAQDHVTDVLSFPSGSMDPETGRLLLGDIAIAYHRALLQARRAKHTLRAELQLLAVHGVLHLLGHDHSEQAEKALMWAAQDAILARLK